MLGIYLSNVSFVVAAADVVALANRVVRMKTVNFERLMSMMTIPRIRTRTTVNDDYLLMRRMK